MCCSLHSILRNRVEMCLWMHSWSTYSNFLFGLYFDVDVEQMCTVAKLLMTDTPAVNYTIYLLVNILMFFFFPGRRIDLPPFLNISKKICIYLYLIYLWFCCNCSDYHLWWSRQKPHLLHSTVIFLFFAKVAKNVPSVEITVLIESLGFDWSVTLPL